MKQNIMTALEQSEKARSGLRVLNDDKVALLIENSLLPALPVASEVFNLLLEAVTRLRRAKGGAR